MRECMRERTADVDSGEGLRAYPWEVSYSTSDVRDDGAPVDILHDFYIPVLERSTCYDRVAGYFSSTSLAAASRGFSRFVGRNGAARFIVGVDLSADDAEAILKGDIERAEAPLNKALGNEGEWPVEVQRGVELLAWMVAHGYLDVKVAIRVHARDGTPKPMDYEGDGYVHEKWAIFEDGRDSLIASGSLNESRTALVLNAENLEIYTSWEGRGTERIGRKRRSFDLMWRGEHPHIRTFDLPEAIRKRLLRIADRVRHLVEVDGIPAPTDSDDTTPVLQPTARERLQFAILRLAPLLPGGEYIGMETAPVTPWPHQKFVARRMIEGYPDNHLMCDEVGLGKTIEAGLAFRALWLSGKASSIRVFAPASLTSQWLHEMSEKFLLPFRRRTGRQGTFETADPLTGDVESGTSDFFDYPLEIISTGLLIHGTGRRLLDSMGETDLVLVDEAHKARRRDPDQTQREPSFNNLYRAVENGIFPKARGLLLATATPMQLNRVEAFDLLRFMYAAGAVRLSPDLCDVFYDLRDRLLDRELPAEHELQFLIRYLADARCTAPSQWSFVDDHVLDGLGQMNFTNLVEFGYEPPGWDEIQPALTMLSPLGRPMMRHTRELLRLYQRDGLLGQNLAQREVSPTIVALNGVERELYDQLQTYCEELANRIAANMEDGRQRAAIGFYLSFLRLRFASSFEALALSLERRLEKIQRTLDHHADHAIIVREEDDPEELSEEELTGLVLRNREPADLTWEQGAVDRLLSSVRSYTQTPRKTQALLEAIQRRHDRSSGRVRQMVVFTRYGDTLKYLHGELTRKLPDCPIGTFSGEGGTLRLPGSRRTQTLDRTSVRRKFVDGAIDILLCTDAAAEGLNLQSADLLINFDLPWNPMLLEQRIGRIDRIGQRHDRVQVSNFLYQGSVEEVVYSRLVDRFRDAASIAGELQFSLLPIEERDFRDYAKTPSEDGKIGWEELLQRAEAHRQRIITRQKLTEFRAEEQREAYEKLEAQAESSPRPVTLEDIWSVLSGAESLRATGCQVESFPHGQAVVVKGVEGIPEGTLLTTSRELFEHGLPAGDDRVLRFATYGDPVFEALVDAVLEGEDSVLSAWGDRRPLAGLKLASGETVRSLRELDDLESIPAEPLKPLPQAGPATGGSSRGQAGMLHERLIAGAAASLSRLKLRDQADGPAAQLGRLDSFIRDVMRRSAPTFQIPVSLPNQSEFLAENHTLFWPVEPAGENVRMTGDPILLRVCRAVIERALAGMERERRTGSAVADRIVRSGQ